MSFICLTYRPQLGHIPTQILGDGHPGNEVKHEFAYKRKDVRLLHLVNDGICLNLIENSIAVGIVKSKHD